MSLAVVVVQVMVPVELLEIMAVKIPTIGVEVHLLCQATRAVVVEVAVDSVSIVVLVIIGNSTVELWSVVESCTVILVIIRIRTAKILITSVI